MRITADWLRNQPLCIPEHVAIFEAEWGESAELTRRGLVRAAELGLIVHWYAQLVLAPEALARYRRILEDDGERERLRTAAIAAEGADRARRLADIRERLREALARAETGRRAMVDPAIERYQALTAGELRAYHEALAALGPGESHEAALARFREVTAPALAELRAVEAQAHAAYREVTHPVEAELVEALRWHEWGLEFHAAHALADVLNLP